VATKSPAPTRKRPSKKTRKKLTREQIVQAAIAFADKKGIEELSMRRLAVELNCGAMSLYHHVADKDELIGLMIDAIAEEIELPSPAQDWAADMRAYIISAYKMMLNHRWAPKHWSQGIGPAKHDYHENILRMLRQSGFSEELACRGYHALTMHVVGFSMQVLELQPIIGSKQKMHTMGKQLLGEMSSERYPYMVEHIEFHLSGKDQRNDFKYLLDLILDGLERDLDSSAR